MPVGVPRVAFQGPGDEYSSWVDIYNRLYRQRALFLGQRIDSTISNQIMGLMIYLTMEDSRRGMDFFINSPGGSIVSGMGIYDLMQVVEPDIQTICLGLAASMASFLLQGGEITKRIAFPHARVMMHQPIADLDPKIRTGESILEITEVIIMYYTVIRIYAQRTGKSPWVVKKDISRDIFMSAEEAQAHGIVDHVGIPY
uniref:ATP-dependent Clp protease proteolytic subunit n=1 Tax=Acacia formidabilis TaxID=1708231 RepID=A0A1D0CC76_9FABA|nr:clpP1 [Acacia formidabilis]